MTDADFDKFIIGAFKHEIERAFMENRKPDQGDILRRVVLTAQVHALAELLGDIEPMLEEWANARQEDMMLAGERIANHLVRTMNELSHRASLISANKRVSGQ